MRAPTGDSHHAAPQTLSYPVILTYVRVVTPLVAMNVLKSSGGATETNADIYIILAFLSETESYLVLLMKTTPIM